VKIIFFLSFKKGTKAPKGFDLTALNTEELSTFTVKKE
jgi:hypothetical protein